MKWSSRRLVLVLSAVLVATVVTAAACGETAPPPASSGAPPAAAPSQGSQPAYTDITPDELAAMLEKKDFLLVNTHIPYEGEIEETDLFLPYDQAADLVAELPEDKAAKVVVYCRTSHMSRIAADVWAAAGYTNLMNLDGGFVAWEEAGYPLLHLQGE